MPGEDFSDLGAPAAAPAAPAPEAPSPDMLAHVDALIQHESSGDPRAVGDKGLALGLGQMHPEVRRAYNVTPESTPEQQRKAVETYFGELWKKHGGNVDDALSEYHLGIPNYERDRQSPANLKYLEEHHKRVGTAPAGEALDFSDLGAEAPTPAPTEPAASATPPARGPIDTLMQGAARAGEEQIGGHEAELTTAGRDTNIALGQPPEHWLGHYTARVNTNVTNALKDAFTGAANITRPTSFRDALDSAMKILHPLALPGEATTDLVWRAMEDSGLAASHPNIASALATGLGLGVGAATPLPGVARGPRMPLQGTAAAREAVGETAGVAERAGAWATAQREAGEASAGVARAEAEKAATEAAPSVAARGRAEEALTPSGEAPAVAGAGVRSALEEKLATAREQTGAIYDAAVKNAQDSGRVLDPSEYPALSRHLRDVRAKLGTLPEEAEHAVTNLENKLNTITHPGERVTAEDLNAYKAAVDQTFPGKMKSGTEVRQALRTLFDETDRPWVEVADNLWRDEIAGRGMTATSLGSIVKLIKKSDPSAVVEKLFGTGKSDAQGAMAQAVMRHLGDSPHAEGLREAVFARMFRPDAEGKVDPKALLRSYDELNPAFRKAFSNPGAETFFKTERELQSAAERATTAAKGAKATEQRIAEAEKVAAGAQAEAQAAAEEAKAPNRLARMTSAGLEFALIGIPLEMLGEHLGVRGAGLYGASAGLGARMMYSTMRSAGRGATMLIPADELAKFLANWKTANLLARALKTPANSAVVPTLMQQLRDSDLGKKLLASPAGQQKQTEAAQTLAEAPRAPQ